MSALAVSGLDVRYGRIGAIEGVSLSVESGSVVTVLGRNGAGKSSLLAAIAGLVKPKAGTVVLAGDDVTALSADARARRGLVLIPEGRGVFPKLTVRENLVLGGFSMETDQRTGSLDQVTELFPILAERIDAPAGQLSGGQQQMLALGRAMMSRPSVLLLDEPSLGLAPKVVDEVYEHLAALRTQGLTIVHLELHRPSSPM